MYKFLRLILNNMLYFLVFRVPIYFFKCTNS